MALVLVGLAVCTQSLWAADEVALSPGEVVFRKIAKKILDAKQIGFSVAADLRGSGPNKGREPISVKIEAAFDSRDEKSEKKRIVVDTQMAGKTIETIFEHRHR